MKTLIVEDDMVSRKILMRFMKKYSDVEVSVNGAEAIEAFLSAHRDKEPFDLVYLDIMMPVLDGTSVLRTIRDYETQKSIPDKDRSVVIMTTALNDKKTVMASYDMGCNAYAWKPLDIHKLREVLVRLNLIDDEI